MRERKRTQETGEVLYKGSGGETVNGLEWMEKVGTRKDSTKEGNE